ncbi:MAG: hypothetical protein QF903_06150 [Planctomycetota bacterium]|jgi:hypothetical protein|nr:hypothetical protein [Planctomycetota bacterium]MDP6989042.1 hypothetical protein [Planctomycetota bacterium]
MSRTFVVALLGSCIVPLVLPGSPSFSAAPDSTLACDSAITPVHPIFGHGLDCIDNGCSTDCASYVHPTSYPDITYAYCVCDGGSVEEPGCCHAVLALNAGVPFGSALRGSCSAEQACSDTQDCDWKTLANGSQIGSCSD